MVLPQLGGSAGAALGRAAPPPDGARAALGGAGADRGGAGGAWDVYLLWVVMDGGGGG